MNPAKQTAEIIALPTNRRERSVHVVKALKKAVDAKMLYLFEGLCVNAADALFEEQFGATDSESMAQHFNITRALRLRGEAQIQEFKTQQGHCWVNLLNRKDTLLVPDIESQISELLTPYAERNRNHYKILLEEIRQRLSALVGQEVAHHPLLPINFCLCFWQSSQSLELNVEERRLLLSLFNRFVMDRFGQVLALVNQSLVEHKINPMPPE